jgi:hypothetical protein
VSIHKSRYFLRALQPPALEPPTSSFMCWSPNHSTYKTLILLGYSSSLFYPTLVLKCVFRILNEFKWKSYQLQSFISFWYLQLWFWSFFHPRSIWIIWISNVRKFNHNFPWIDDFKWKSCRLQCFTTFWDLHFCFGRFSIQGRLKFWILNFINQT